MPLAENFVITGAGKNMGPELAKKAFRDIAESHFHIMGLVNNANMVSKNFG